MQCTNYLKATRLRPCLLLKFGKPRLEMKRVANGLCATLDHLRVQRASALNLSCPEAPWVPAPQAQALRARMATGLPDPTRTDLPAEIPGGAA